MDAPPPEHHRFLTDLAISIIGGLLTIIISIVGWFTKDHVKELRKVREKLQEMEVAHTNTHANCVTREELDRKFNLMREDQKDDQNERDRRMDQRHQENLETLRELRDGYRAVHERIDEFMSSKRH